jgi:hypothetical protein
VDQKWSLAARSTSLSSKLRGRAMLVRYQFLTSSSRIEYVLD